MKTYSINESTLKSHEKLNLKTLLNSLLKDGIGLDRDTVDENAIKLIFAMHQQTDNVFRALPVNDQAYNYFLAERQLTSRAVDFILKMENETAWRAELCAVLNVTQFLNKEIQSILDAYKCQYLGERIVEIGHLNDEELAEFRYFFREAFLTSGPIVTMCKTAATGLTAQNTYLREVFVAMKLRRPMSEELKGDTNT